MRKKTKKTNYKLGAIFLIVYFLLVPSSRFIAKNYPKGSLEGVLLTGILLIVFLSTFSSAVLKKRTGLFSLIAVGTGGLYNVMEFVLLLTTDGGSGFKIVQIIYYIIQIIMMGCLGIKVLDDMGLRIFSNLIHLFKTIFKVGFYAIIICRLAMLFMLLNGMQSIENMLITAATFLYLIGVYLCGLWIFEWNDPSLQNE